MIKLSLSRTAFAVITLALSFLVNADKSNDSIEITQQTVATTTGAVKHLQQQLGRIQTFSANFVQLTQDSFGNTLQQVNGFMQVAKPGKLNWKTEGIYEQLVISDGSSVWIYDADLMQVSIKNMSNKLSETPALLLGGDVSAIDNDFIITETPHKTKTLFVLQPKDTSQLFDSLELTFNKLNKDSPLTQMVIRDASGQVTEISFSNIITNPKLSPSVFTFTTPEGVDVIDGRHAQ